jgi:hypothetical protein
MFLVNRLKLRIIYGGSCWHLYRLNVPAFSWKMFAMRDRSVNEMTTYLGGHTVEFRKNGIDRHLRNDILFYRILKQRRGRKIDGQK